MSEITEHNKPISPENIQQLFRHVDQFDKVSHQGQRVDNLFLRSTKGGDVIFERKGPPIIRQIKQFLFRNNTVAGGSKQLQKVLDEVKGISLSQVRAALTKLGKNESEIDSDITKLTRFVTGVTDFTGQEKEKTQEKSAIEALEGLRASCSELISSAPKKGIERLNKIVTVATDIEQQVRSSSFKREEDLELVVALKESIKSRVGDLTEQIKLGRESRAGMLQVLDDAGKLETLCQNLETFNQCAARLTALQTRIGTLIREKPELEELSKLSEDAKEVNFSTKHTASEVAIAKEKIDLIEKQVKNFEGGHFSHLTIAPQQAAIPSEEVRQREESIKESAEKLTRFAGVFEKQQDPTIKKFLITVQQCQENLTKLSEEAQTLPEKEFTARLAQITQESTNLVKTLVSYVEVLGNRVDSRWTTDQKGVLDTIRDTSVEQFDEKKLTDLVAVISKLDRKTKFIERLNQKKYKIFEEYAPTEKLPSEITVGLKIEKLINYLSDTGLVLNNEKEDMLAWIKPLTYQLSKTRFGSVAAIFGIFETLGPLLEKKKK